MSSSLAVVHIFFINIFLASIMTEIYCQSCVESGRTCLDDAACCGGCCRNGLCIDMYGPCYIHNDLCLNHYCPPGLVCYIYQTNCVGCSPVADCKEPWLDY